MTILVCDDDKEIVEAISKHTSLSEEYVQQVIESAPHPLFPITIGQSMSYTENYQMHQIQKVYQAQCEIIKDLASKSNCVIVGRCADYILREMKPYRIFIYADLDSRIKRCVARSTTSEQYTEKQLKKHILKIDKGRAKYYEYYTGQKWSDKINYDLCINTTNINIKEIVPLIAKMFKKGN